LITGIPRYIHSLLFVLLLGMLLMPWSLAVSPQVQAQAQPGISSPASDSTVSGDVVILGTATIDPFQKYELHYKLEPSSDDAFIYFDGGTTPIINGQLGVLQAGGLAPGVYSLRLRVVKNDGNYAEYYARNVSINQGAVPTPTPEESLEPTETPIPTATFTPAPQPTPDVGVVALPQAGAAPTATPEAVAAAPAEVPADQQPADAPAEALPAAEVAPVVEADNVAVAEGESNSLTRQLGEAMALDRLRTHFFNGVRYSAALFIGVGLVFAGRRLLHWLRTRV